MTHPPDVTPGSEVRYTGQPGGRGTVLVLSFLLMLAAVFVSTGLVVYTALRHDLTDGPFALAFAILSARAALSWFLWRGSHQQSAMGYQQVHEGRKPVDETTQ